MELLRRYGEFRSAFEQTYQDDDWARLEPFLAPEATYEVLGAPFFCVVEGRAAVLAAIQRSVSGFDRHCVRELTSLAPPVEEGNKLLVYGQVSYRRGNEPAIVASLRQIAEYRDGLIVRIQDIYDPGMDERCRRWFAQWGEGLDWSYVGSACR